MDQKKNSFLLYMDIEEQIRMLSNTDAGKLFKAIFRYVGSGEEPDNLSQLATMCFMGIRKSLDRDNAKWETIIEKRRTAGRKGGLAKGKQKEANEANAIFAKQNLANQAVSVSVPVSVPVSVSDSVHVSVNNTRAGEDDFEVFWSAYPRKVDKPAARKAFDKVDVSMEVLLKAIEEQKRSTQWTKNNGLYIPNPANWLNGRRWEDAPVEEALHGQQARNAQFQKHGEISELGKAAIAEMLAWGEANMGGGDGG